MAIKSKHGSFWKPRKSIPASYIWCCNLSLIKCKVIIIHIFVPENKIGWNEDISWHSCMNTRLVQRHWMNVLCVCNWNSFKFYDSWNLTMSIFSRLNWQFRLVDLEYSYQTYWDYIKNNYKNLHFFELLIIQRIS